MFSDSGEMRRAEALPSAALLFLRAVERNRYRLTLQTGLTATELRAISRIAEAGTISPNELAHSLNMTRAAVTAISEQLLSKSLIVRDQHQSDRRRLVFSLTPEGVELVEVIYARFEDAIAVSSANLGADQYDLLVDTLTRIAGVLEASVELPDDTKVVRRTNYLHFELPNTRLGLIEQGARSKP